MKFRKHVTQEMADQLVRLGLQRCPICDGEPLTVDRRPSILSIGGFHHEEDDPRRDPEANVLFMLRVECEICGYTMLFNSEKHSPPDEPVLQQHWLNDEDDPNNAG